MLGDKPENPKNWYNSIGLSPGFTVVPANQKSVKQHNVVRMAGSNALFLLRMRLPKQARVKEHINKFVMVMELYNDSPSTYKRSKSHQNLGMASVTMLTEDGGRDE